MNILLIEPCFHGLPYVAESKRRGDVTCVISSSGNPAEFGYSDIEVESVTADIWNAADVVSSLESLRTRRFDAVIPGNEYVIPTAARVARHYGTRGLEPYDADNCRSKYRQREAFREGGLLNPRFWVVRGRNEIPAQADLTFPCVVKPDQFSASEHVMLVESYSRLRDAVENVLVSTHSALGFSSNGVCLIEEFIDGPEYSVEMLIDANDIKFAFVTEKFKGSLPRFVETGHLSPARCDVRTADLLTNTAFRAAKALRIGGPVHAEIRVRGDSAWLMEVNARPGGGGIWSQLIPNAYSVRPYSHCVDYYLGLETKVQVQQGQPTAVAFIVADRPGIVRIADMEIHDSGDSYVKCTSIQAKAGDLVDSPASADDRLGFVVCEGPTSSIALSRAQTEASRLAALLVTPLDGVSSV